MSPVRVHGGVFFLQSKKVGTERVLEAVHEFNPRSKVLTRRSIDSKGQAVAFNDGDGFVQTALNEMFIIGTQNR